MFIPRKKITDTIYEALKLVPITVLIGARQVGKTTILKNLKFEFSSVYLIGQEPETAAIFQKFSLIEMFLKKNLNEELKGYLLIDEFQFINDISTNLKLLCDKHTGLKIICSGSSSLDIIQNVSESLAGRVRFINIYSLSFSEYLRFNGDEYFDLFNKYDNQTADEVVAPSIKNLFDEYLGFGGMPRIALTAGEDSKIQLLSDIYKSYLLRDVRSYVRNEDSVGFNKLLILLASQISNMVNVNELSNSCSLSYRKCEEYIYLLEQMFIIRLIEPFFTNKRKVISKMKKIFFTDLGLRNVIIGNFQSLELRSDTGALFENLIFLEIIKKIPPYSKIFYYRTKDGSEVDFIVDDLKNKFAVETKFRNFRKGTKLRNISSIQTIDYFRKIYVVNKNYNSEVSGINFIQGYLMEKAVFE